MTVPIRERGYARPEVLVSTDWVAAHLEDPSGRPHGMFGVATEVHEYLIKLRRIGQYGA